MTPGIKAKIFNTGYQEWLEHRESLKVEIKEETINKAFWGG